MKGLFSKAKNKLETGAQLFKKDDQLSVQSATEPPEIKEATKDLENTKTRLLDTKRRFEKFQKTTGQQVNDHHVASESLKTFSQDLGVHSSYTVLADFMNKVVGFSERMQELQSDLNTNMMGKFTSPIGSVIEGDIAEAEFSKKRFNKVLSDYDNINNKIKQMNAKGANLQKVMEVQKEQEQLEAKYNKTCAQTLESLSDVNQRIEFSMFQILMQYLEMHQQYFAAGTKTIDALLEDAQKYRLYSEKKREAHENGAPLETIRLQDIAEQHAAAAPRDELEQAVETLLQQERSYVRKLYSIIKTYIENIRVDDQLSSKMEPEDYRIMFGNVEDLYVLHRQLVEELENDLRNYPQYHTGQIFLKFLPQMKAYNFYIRNHSRSINALKQLQKRSQSFARFIKTMDRKTGLEALLGEPISRIPRYVILLQAIQEQTHPASEEHVAMAEAVEQLTKLSTELQESHRVSQNVRTVLPVYNSLSGFPDNLLEPSRVFVHEGALNVEFDTGEGQLKTENHHFFLFNDILIDSKKRTALELAKDKVSKEAEFGKRWNYIMHWSLAEVAVVDLPDTEELHNRFELVTGAQKRTFFAQTAEDKQHWCSMIRKGIDGGVVDAVFEVPLALVMQNQRDQALDIPEVVAVCAKYLHERALDVEGLFRMSGAKREIAHMISMFNKGQEVVPEHETEDEHTVAGVLKRWVRLLPEPLLTYELFDDFLQAGTAGQHLDDLAYLKECLHRLPNINRYTVQELFKLLHAVVQHSEENKMDPKNVAIVFAPGLLAKEDASPFDTSHYEAAYSVVGNMALHYEEIFADTEAEREANKRASRLASSNRKGSTQPQQQQQEQQQRSSSAAQPSAPPAHSLPPPNSNAPAPVAPYPADRNSNSRGSSGAPPVAAPRPTPDRAAAPTPHVTFSQQESPSSPPPRGAPPGARRMPGFNDQLKATLQERASSTPALKKQQLSKPESPTANSGSSSMPASPAARPKEPAATRSGELPPQPASRPLPPQKPAGAKRSRSPAKRAPAAPKGGSGGVRGRGRGRGKLAPRKGNSSGALRKVPAGPRKSAGAAKRRTASNLPPIKPPKPNAAVVAQQNASAPPAATEEEEQVEFPKCSKCEQDIVGTGLKALNKVWHKECFVCAHCSKPFSGKILQKKGQPYCGQDYRALFGSPSKVCGACNEKISGPFMKALDKYWHPDHFLCKDCGGSVQHGYYDKDGFPYCGNCFDE